jgi:aspartate carbamoyltransferase catalytic subunit
MLRLQRERMVEALIGDESEYFSRFGLDARRLRLAASNAMVMHPGPINRGIEIAADVADGPQSVILEQVANGIPVRMAVMESLLASDHSTQSPRRE